MKELLTFGIFYLFVISSSAQSTKELFSDCGLSQVFDYFFDTPLPDPQSIGYLRDTTRNGDEVLEYELATNGPTDTRRLEQFFRIDGQKVYFYNRRYDGTDTTVVKEYLFYDFEPSVGEEVMVPHVNQPGFLFNFIDYTVIEKSVIQLSDGQDRIHMVLELNSNPSITIEWIEGIGNAKGGILRPAYRQEEVILGCVSNFNGLIWIADNFTEEECEDRLNWLSTQSLPCDITSSTLELERKLAAIYPNPASGQLTIKSNSLVSGTFYLYNMLGVEMMSMPITSSESLMDCSGLNSGCYLLQVTNENGKLIQSEKVILNNF